ncbi:MAG: hypothetical protein Q4P28_01675 [Tissierellia bacterium]|nr:hypothetical protein [Tissierellia bacterium]
MDIKEFFLEEHPRLYYLELKEGKRYFKGEDLPLPIVKDDFLENIKKSRFREEVEIKHFIKGMIFNISIDPEFKYNERYLEILKEWTKDLQGLIFQMGISSLSKPKDAIHFFHANEVLGVKDRRNRFFYGFLLHELTKDVEIRRKILLMMNELLRENPEFPLPYFGLANIEIHQGNYLKANLYLEQALEKIDHWEEEEGLKQSLKEMIQSQKQAIEKDSKLQEASLYLEQGSLKKAQEILLSFDGEIGIVQYLLGKVALKSGQYHGAKEYFDRAYDLDYRELSYYLDASFTDFELGFVKGALDKLTEGLERYIEDENLLYNRAMVYITLEEFEKAKEDLSTIISYDDINENIFNQAMGILQYLEKR